MSTYARQRRTHLEALAGQLPSRGLAGRFLIKDNPILWVWNPRTGRQTVVFATPVKDGWLLLWARGGQGDAEHPGPAAEAIKSLLGTEPEP
ncbi:hypothetical protein [Rhizohabitans arisaemae]|uniref:hypothetical protein n=1 Tax=Rhizohabitans arisaemae TaxID=2720610 RepID=UPI0024B10C4E|nr:hypothetical protein [Rhizohabitans arisaemae]